MTGATPILLRPGSVVTGDPCAPVAEAVLIDRGVVAGVGRYDDLCTAAPGATVVELAGCSVVPGLVESHMHPVYTAMTAGWADCRSPGCSSIDEVVGALTAHLDRAPDGWVRGWGYDDTLLAERRHPTRDDLDRVGGDRPVVVSHISGHFAVANTRALDLAGLREDVVARDDHRFPRGDDGRLTGMLWEIDAVARVFDLIPAPTRAELREALLDTLHTAVSRGITTLHDLGVGLIAGTTELEVYRALDTAGELPLHVAGFLRGDLLGAVEAGFDAERDPGARFRLAGAKFWADGSIQGLSAALRIPYECRSDHRGELLQDTGTLSRMCRDAAAVGAQVAVHANGDAAVAAAIEALAPLQRERAGRAPHRIEHCQVSTHDDLAAVHASGLGVSFFANHLYYWGDRHRDLFLGPDRAADMDALAWADRLGQRYGLHSDCPITPMDPLATMWSATSRRTRDGHVLGAHQRISPMRALRAMTVDSHWLVGDHEQVGTLRTGRRADLVAIDRDLDTLGPDGLRDATASAVMVEGRWAVAP